ncbi:unnamed protein product [Amoebophrya sp. A120]|nr:unnamed protein product [Amoebophrya sp. A120]|eukprot:GSA120T00007578001.1
MAPAASRSIVRTTSRATTAGLYHRTMSPMNRSGNNAEGRNVKANQTRKLQRKCASSATSTCRSLVAFWAATAASGATGAFAELVRREAGGAAAAGGATGGIAGASSPSSSSGAAGSASQELRKLGKLAGGNPHRRGPTGFLRRHHEDQIGGRHESLSSTSSTLQLLQKKKLAASKVNVGTATASSTSKTSSNGQTAIASSSSLKLNYSKVGKITKQRQAQKLQKMNENASAQVEKSQSTAQQEQKAAVEKSKKITRRHSKIVEQLEAFVSTEDLSQVTPSLISVPSLPEAEYKGLLTEFVNNQESRYIENDGNKKAREYIKAYLEKLPNLDVREEEFDCSGVKCYNVVAELKAKSGNENQPIIAVGAHYDSRPFGQIAPGADDNASGVASMLIAAEKATKYFEKAQTAPNRPIYFVAFSAEEEGLYGSAAFAEKLQEQKKSVYQALIMDQVGYQKTPSGPTGLIFETKGEYPDPSLDHTKQPQQHLVNLLGELSKRIVSHDDPSKLDLSVNYHGFGSDHISMLNHHFPAVLLIERDNLDAEAKFGHTIDDTLDNISWPFATRIAQLASYATIEMGLEEITGSSSNLTATTSDSTTTSEDGSTATSTTSQEAGGEAGTAAPVATASATTSFL